MQFLLALFVVYAILMVTFYFFRAAFRLVPPFLLYTAAAGAAILFFPLFMVALAKKAWHHQPKVLIVFVTATSFLVYGLIIGCSL